jgi:type IV pilus assembly protein PilE
MTRRQAEDREKRQKGMTLIELMVVVVIIAILAGIGFPSYQAHVRKGNRATAQQLMLDIASRQEQYLLDARSYTATLGGSTGLNLSPQGWDCTSTNTKCSNSFYEVTVAAVAPAAGVPPSFTITATAKGNQLSDGNLTLNNTGQKTPTGKW